MKTTKMFLLAMALALCILQSGADKAQAAYLPLSPVPSRMNLFDGSYFYGINIELKANGMIQYTIFGPDDNGERRSVQRTAAPTIPEWRAFLRSCERIGVWSWGREYIDPQIMDGKQWSVDIEYKDTGGRVARHVKSAGSNSYPPDGQSIARGVSRDYTALWEAVKRLIGETDLKL